MKEIHWLFFDVGSTLVNEEKAYKDRIEQAIADTNILCSILSNYEPLF